MIYKLLRPEEWARFQKEGRFTGSAQDLEDGYIHFSTREQLAETARLHFAGIAGVVVLEVEDVRLEDVRWEPSRGGRLFPHLYGPLDMKAVASSGRLEDYVRT